MMRAYPCARLGRVAVVTNAVYQYTGSVELSAVAGVSTDVCSVAIEARPFLPTWPQFWLACVFLPWLYASYWDMFVDQNRSKPYGLEAALLLAILLGEGSQKFCFAL